MASIVFILLICLVGGVIAYFADRLGRTLGKKRLSIFGLRPRHTAELLTVAAGVFIPLVTFAIIMGASRDVREWVLNGPKVISQRDTALRERNNANKELGIIQQNLREQRDKLNDLQGRLGKAQAALVSLQKRETQLLRDVDQRTKQLASAQRSFNAVNRQYTEANRRLVSVQADYRTTQQNLKKVRSSYAELDKTYAKLNTDYKTLQQTFAELNQQREDANREVARDREELGKLNNQLTQKQGQLDTTEKAYNATKALLDQAQLALDDAKARYDEVVQRLNATILGGTQMNILSRSQPMIYGLGDEVARLPVLPSMSQNEAKDLYRETMRIAAANAEKAGAGNQSGRPAATLAVDADHPEQPQVESIIKDLTSRKQPGLVIVNSFWNSFVQETVPVRVHVYDNPIVYHKNEPIAETMVQGDLDAQKIFGQISDFVRTKVQQSAKDHHMIPAAGRENSFGQILPGDILTLVTQIRNWGRPVRLIAYAGQDTRAGDALDLKFQLR